MLKWLHAVEERIKGHRHLSGSDDTMFRKITYSLNNNMILGVGEVMGKIIGKIEQTLVSNYVDSIDRILLRENTYNMRGLPFNTCNSSVRILLKDTS